MLIPLGMQPDDPALPSESLPLRCKGQPDVQENEILLWRPDHAEMVIRPWFAEAPLTRKRGIAWALASSRRIADRLPQAMHSGGCVHESDAAEGYLRI